MQPSYRLREPQLARAPPSPIAPRPGAKSKVTLKAGGFALATPALPLALPLTVQLQMGNAGCFEAHYLSAGVVQNDASKARLRADP